jgi:hypothetical protein
MPDSDAFHRGRPRHRGSSGKPRQRVVGNQAGEYVSDRNKEAPPPGGGGGTFHGALGAPPIQGTLESLLPQRPRRFPKRGFQTMKLEQLTHGLCMATDESGEAVLASNFTEGLQPVHLWQVILSRDTGGAHPVTSIHHCLAATGEGAVSQVETEAFPEIGGYVPLAIRKAQLTSMAIRLPLQIRGWGNQKF